jgi:energy-coupling factor transport system permease protein
MKNIGLGQYYPAQSVMHRLDPRAKVICAIIYIVAAFLCRNFFSFIILAVSAPALILISRIPVGVVLRSVRALLFIMVFTAILNLFWTTDATAEPLVSFWIIKIYKKGIFNALFIIIRILAMVVGSSLFLTYTTTPIALTDAIESLLSPLKKIKVPVHEFAMMMTIALRFIPTIVDEADKIMSAQKARGSDFSTGNVAQRVKALVPVIIPLFASSFRRAGELATAMECRCYHGGKGRTRLKQLRFSFGDFAFMFLMAAIIIGSIVAVNIFGVKYGWIYSM